MKSVDPEEVARFAAQAGQWWDPHGPFRPLHRFNPARLAILRDWIAEHFAAAERKNRPFEGLNLIDVGCGGGLICEPMTRLGASVLGIDAGEENIAAARAHGAALSTLDYRAATAEEIAEEGRQFDVVLALEIVEHVADPEIFLAALARLARPGGLVVAATINRTAKAFALAIVGAEYLLNWVPRGTHDWRKFLTPAELREGLARQGLDVVATAGLTYDPLFDRWSRSADLGVNYMLAARRPV